MAKSIAAGTDYDEQFFTSSLLVPPSRARIGSSSSPTSATRPRILGASTRRPPEATASSRSRSPPASPTTQAGTLARREGAARQARRPNVLVKIPATLEGIPAIEEMIAEGHSINVTLIFSLERYEAVIDAYQRGLERLLAAGGHPSAGRLRRLLLRRAASTPRSTAVSRRSPPGAARSRRRRWRCEARRRSPRRASPTRSSRSASRGERFAALAARGARAQRPLWASTSTKNPDYPDLLYVESLVGPDTVDTMPGQTVEAFFDHGHVARTVDAAPEEARQVIDRLAEVGIDLEEVTAQLEREGVAAFAKSFDELMESLRDKAGSLDKGR